MEPPSPPEPLWRRILLNTGEFLRHGANLRLVYGVFMILLGTGVIFGGMRSRDQSVFTFRAVTLQGPQAEMASNLGILVGFVCVGTGFYLIRGRRLSS